MYRAVDCQGFAGGFTLGMVQAGFTLVGKREMKGGFGVANCERNRELLGNAWHSEATDPEEWSPVDADVVFGNPPCSGFSVMSARDFRGADSKINHCMWAFVDYAAKVKPHVAVFESVQNAYTSSDGHALMLALRARLEDRTGERYALHHVRHNAIAIGGAAVRRRYFWLASRVPFGIERPSLPRYPVLNDVIGDLATLSWTWQAQPYRSPPSWWSDQRRSKTGAVDGHMGLSNPLTRRMADLMAGVEWSPGMAIGEVARRYWDTHARLPDSWSATEEKVVKNDFFMGFTTPVRWHGDRYGRVITGGGLHNVVHPFLDRTITHRETARILGFPDDWRILPLRGVSGLNLTWGKGITVDCGRWVGRWIRAALDDRPGSYAGDLIGDREYDIDVTNDYPRNGGLPITVLDINTRSSTPGTVKTATTPVKSNGSTKESPMAETEVGEATPETPAGRGRPRPNETIERDAKVLEAIKTAEGGSTTNPKLVEVTGIPKNQVYLSLYRLKRDGHITRNGSNWTAVAAEAPVA